MHRCLYRKLQNFIFTLSPSFMKIDRRAKVNELKNNSNHMYWTVMINKPSFGM